MNEAAEPAAIEGDASESAESVSVGRDDILSEVYDLVRGLPPAAQGKFSLLVSPERISYETGIEPERVAALLRGAVPDRDDSKEAAQARFLGRLHFLRRTRLTTPMTRRLSGRVPREFGYGEISRGAKVPKQTVHKVFTEGRLTSPESLAKIERFFGVLPGWCFYTEHEALADHFNPIVSNLRVLATVAAAYGSGVKKVAARSTDDLRQPDAMDEVLTAVMNARHRRR